MTGRREMALDRLSRWIHSPTLRKGISRTRLWSGLYFIHLLEGNLPEVVFPARQDQRNRIADNDRVRGKLGLLYGGVRAFLAE